MNGFCCWSNPDLSCSKPCHVRKDKLGVVNILQNELAFCHFSFFGELTASLMLFEN